MEDLFLSVSEANKPKIDTVYSLFTHTKIAHCFIHTILLSKPMYNSLLAVSLKLKKKNTDPNMHTHPCTYTEG